MTMSVRTVDETMPPTIGTAMPPGVQYNMSFIAWLQDMAPTPEMGQGFGLGFKVRKDEGRNPLLGSG
jgi:hypothetical protein